MTLAVAWWTTSCYVEGVPLKEMFPFGSKVNDSVLPAADTAHARVKLQPPIPFYGIDRHYATVSLVYFRICTSRCFVTHGCFSLTST